MALPVVFGCVVGVVPRETRKPLSRIDAHSGLLVAVMSQPSRSSVPKPISNGDGGSPENPGGGKTESRFCFSPRKSLKRRSSEHPQSNSPPARSLLALDESYWRLVQQARPIVLLVGGLTIRGQTGTVPANLPKTC